MSKTFTYILAVIVLYLVVVMPNLSTSNKNEKEEKEEKKDKKESTGSGVIDEESKDENGVYRGASGQMKYRIGHTN